MAPDTNGVQLQAIRAHLHANRSVELVWFECVAKCLLTRPSRPPRPSPSPHTHIAAHLNVFILLCWTHVGLDAGAIITQTEYSRLSPSSYWCMPQKHGMKRSQTPAEREEFKAMLPNVNLLYLFTQVLILMDLSYASRFWVRHLRDLHLWPLHSIVAVCTTLTALYGHGCASADAV